MKTRNMRIILVLAIINIFFFHSFSFASMHEYEDVVEYSIRVLYKSKQKDKLDLRSIFWNLYKFQEGYDTGFTNFRVTDILLKEKYSYRFKLLEHPDYQKNKEFFEYVRQKGVFAYIDTNPSNGKTNALLELSGIYDPKKSYYPIYDSEKLKDYIGTGYYQPPYLYCDAGSPLWKRFAQMGRLKGKDAESPVEMDLIELVKIIVEEAEKQKDLELIRMWYTLLIFDVVNSKQTDELVKLENNPSLIQIRDIVRRTKAYKIYEGYGYLKYPLEAEELGDYVEDANAINLLKWWFEPVLRINYDTTGKLTIESLKYAKKKTFEMLLLEWFIKLSPSFRKIREQAKEMILQQEKEINKPIKIESAEIIDYGIYEVKEDSNVEEETVVTGYNVVISEIELLEKTENIPAELGICFGFRYLLKGKPDGAIAGMTIKVSHPPIENPNTGKVLEYSWWTDYGLIGGMNWNNTGWIFKEEWEVVPGRWTIQLFYKDKKLAEKSFNVYKP